MLRALILMMSLLVTSAVAQTSSSSTGSQAPVAAPLPAPLQGTDPALHEKSALLMPKNASLPTLWLVGDSTVRNGHGDGAGGQWGWGEPLVDLFDTSQINLVNRAIGGRSSRTFITEGHWQELLTTLKPGDFVLIQFGHNDSGPLDDTARARGSLPGIGDDTREIENPILKRHETVHTYGWYMRQYVEQAKAKGATVIVCTLIPRKIWEGGLIVRSGADSYGGWAREIAVQEHVVVVDLNEIIARQYDAMGQESVEPLFADPHTHTSLAGAALNARAVVLGLKLLHPDPLKKYFSSAATVVPSTMPTEPSPEAASPISH